MPVFEAEEPLTGKAKLVIKSALEKLKEYKQAFSEAKHAVATLGDADLATAHELLNNYKEKDPATVSLISDLREVLRKQGSGEEAARDNGLSVESVKDLSPSKRGSDPEGSSIASDSSGATHLNERRVSVDRATSVRESIVSCKTPRDILDIVRGSRGKHKKEYLNAATQGCKEILKMFKANEASLEDLYEAPLVFFDALHEYNYHCRPLCLSTIELIVQMIDDTEYKIECVKGKVVHHIVEMMIENADEDGILVDACACLAGLSSLDETKALIIKTDAPKQVLTAMRSYASAELQLQCCGVFWNLCFRNDENKGILGTLGVISQILDALRSNKKSHRVVAAAMGALESLSVSEANEIQLVELHSVEDITGAMKKNLKYHDVQSRGLGVLFNLASTTEAGSRAERMINEGTLTAIYDVIETYSDDVNLLCAALTLLRLLAVNTSTIKAIEDSGIMKPVDVVVAKHQSDARLKTAVDQWMWAMRHLSHGKAESQTSSQKAPVPEPKKKDKTPHIRKKRRRGTMDMADVGQEEENELSDSTDSPVTCPNNHALEIQKVQYKGLDCDMCGQTLDGQKTSYSCEKCDYDICTKCMHKARPKKPRHT